MNNKDIFWGSDPDSVFWTKKYDKAFPEDNLLSAAIRALPDAIRTMIATDPRTSYPDARHDSFGSTGNFRCPCCGNKIALYEPKAGSVEYEINNFGHCPDFGKNGRFPSDAIGIYMAHEFGQNTKGNARRAIAALSLDNLTMRGPSEEEMRARALAERYEDRRRRSETNVAAVRDATLWGDDMPPEAAKALRARGLENLSLLSEGTRRTIGWVKDVRLKCLTRDSDYVASGLVFSLDGGRGYQIRRVGRNGEFIRKDTKGTARFYTIGPAGPFNIDALDFSNGLDPVFVTEGPMDAVTMEMALKRDDAGPDHVRVLSIQGCENTSYLADELRHRGGFFSVFLALDADDHGVEAQMRLDGLLRENPNVTVLPFPGYMGYKDMNALWMADRSKAAAYMKTVHSIGRHMMDGRISPDRGMELLLGMGDMTLQGFESRHRQVLERFRDAINEMSSVPTVSEARYRQTADSVMSKTVAAVQGGKGIER